MEAGRHAFLKSKQVDIMQLILASASGDRKQVQLLLGMGADVNTRDSELHIHTQEIHIHVYCTITRLCSLVYYRYSL